MLPQYDSEDRHGHEDDEQSEVAVPIVECLAWGSVAECGISLCCPLLMHGTVDATATILNLLCPLLGGMAQALEDASSTSTPVRQRVAAFQTGFVGVSTSFSFMAEQASLIEDSWRGALYICATLMGASISFAAGHFALSTALRGRQLRRALVAGRILPSAPRLRRCLALLVLTAWLWVLIAPAGAVFDPHAVRAAKSRAGLMGDKHTAVETLNGSSESKTDNEESPQASKFADCLHLACGLLMQAAGLTASARLGERVAGRRSGATERTGGKGRGTGLERGSDSDSIVLGPLASNAAALSTLVLVRSLEAARWLDDDGVIAAKVRTSFCGALSVSGMLGQLLLQPKGDAGAAMSGSAIGTPEGNLSAAARPSARGMLNLAAHASLAAAAMLLLPRTQAWAADSATS